MSLGFSRNSCKFQNLRREEARNFPMSLRLYKELQPIWVEISEFFLVPGHSSRETAIYDDSHLASLGASLYCVPDPIHRVKLGISYKSRGIKVI